MPHWRLGTIGFGYSDWDGVFYRKGMKSGDHLAFYAKYFDTVELDTTFHAPPRASAYGDGPRPSRMASASA